MPVVADFRLESGGGLLIEDGEVLVRTVYISMDPHTRAEIGTLADGVSAQAQEETLPQLPVGAVINGYALGEVIGSRCDRLREGDLVRGYWGWQSTVVARYGGTDEGRPAASQEQVQQGDNVVFKLDPRVRPASYAMHVLGEMGLTAYVGLTAVGQPQPGEIVLVSSAAGTVGGVAGQVAKALGCRVVGSVGSRGKAEYVVRELGFDAAVLHRGEDLGDQLDAACPEGIDVYFDNVGGALSDAVLARLRPRARVVLCGATADWNSDGPSIGPRPYWPLLVRRAKVEGFVLWDHEDKYEAGFERLLDWSQDGTVQVHEEVVQGFDKVPAAFIDFLSGAFHGKVLVQVGPDPSRTGLR